MKYLGKIQDNNDIITKGYLDDRLLENTESIQVILGDADGILCEKVNNKHIVPIASETLGVVKGSSAETLNGVSVSLDGTMSVNKIEISKLYISEGDALILDGGDSLIGQ